MATKHTNQIEELIRLSEHPKVEYWEKKIKTGLQRSILAFQVAFGALSFGSATAFLYSLDPNVGFRNMPWGWITIWFLFFFVYLGTIQSEHWKEENAQRRQRVDVDIRSKEEFNTRFVHWQYEQAKEMTNEDALQFFQNGLVMFASISIESMNRKLTDMMMMMNNLVFNTNQALQGNSIFDKVKKVVPPIFKRKKYVDADAVSAVETPTKPEIPTEEIEDKLDEALQNTDDVVITAEEQVLIDEAVID